MQLSGWDEDEIFFAEKSHMDWEDFAGKHISFRHMLPEGAIVFVRTLQPTAMHQSSLEARRLRGPAARAHPYRNRVTLLGGAFRWP